MAGFDPFGSLFLDPRIARDPLVLLRGGRSLPKARGAERHAAPAPVGLAALPSSLEAWPSVAMPEPVAPEPARARPPADVGSEADLTAGLDPAVAAIGGLLTRPGQMREQGRQAGAQSSAAGSFGSGVAAGADLNFGDELSGLHAASGLPGWVPGMIAPAVGAARMGLDAAGVTGGGASQAYADQRDFARGYQDGSREAHPVAEIGGQLAGGLVLPGGAVRGATTAGSVGRGMAAGALSGAAAGFGAGEDIGDRALQAGAFGTIGGTLGGVAPALPSLFGGMPVLSRPAAGAVMREAAEVAPALPASTRIADGVIDAMRGGPRGAEPPSLGFGPYGSGGRSIGAEDGMEAIRAGIARNLTDPTLGQRPAAPASGASVFDPFGASGLSPRESAAFGEIGRFLRPAAAGAAGIGVAAGAASAADGAAPLNASSFDARFNNGTPGQGYGVDPAVVATLRSKLIGSAPPAAAASAPTRSLFDPPAADAPATTGSVPPTRPMDTRPQAPADVPAPGAVPVIGRAPLGAPSMPPASPVQPATAPVASSAPETGSIFDTFRANGGPDLLNSLAIGLASAPGWSRGVATGLKLNQEAGDKRAVADLARLKTGMELAKYQREAGGLTGNAAILKQAYPELTEAQASAQASNGPAVTEALKIIRDRNHGRENDPDVIRMKAQAHAEGEAAGKLEPDYNLGQGQTRYSGTTNQPIAAVAPEKPQNFDTERNLRTEFAKGLGTFQDVHDGYGRVIAATRQREANPNGKSPASDIGLIFGYMKMLDPGSVVREGEYATAANAAGLDDRLRNTYNRLLNGEFLTPEQRQDFIGQANELYGTARKTAEGVAGRYRNLAGQYGVDPGRTVYLPEMPTPPVVGRDRMKPGAAGQPRAALGSPATKTIGGKTYIQGTDGEWYGQ